MNGIMYVDVYFLINLVMDLLSLSVTSLICGEKIKILKLLISAFFGAASSVALLIAEFNDLLNFIIAVFSLLIMCLIAIGIRRRKAFCIFFIFLLASEIFIGGLINAIYFNFMDYDPKEKITLSVLIAVAALAYTIWNLWGKMMKRKIDTKVVSLSISFGGKNVNLFGLIDSGNMLTEPSTNYPVILIKEEAAYSLLGNKMLNEMKKGFVSEDITLYRIPIKSVGGSSELIGFEPSDFYIFGKKRSFFKKDYKNVIIAVDYTKGGFAGCPCLVPISAV